MKTVGIIGGFAPESTVDYYRSIIASYRLREPHGNYPSIIINSINLNEMLDLIAANELTRVTERLLDELRRLERAGVDFALLACNLLHIVFNELRRESSVPLISIVEATAQEAIKLKLKRVGLIGARLTMQSRFYPDVLSKHEITVVTPNREEQAYIHDKYIGELVNGIFLPETRERLLQTLDELEARERIDGVILGGTELPLLLRESLDKRIPFLDTTAIHVAEIVTRLLATE